MNLIFRFLILVLTSGFKKKLNPFETCHTKFTVLPTDLDILIHMNNGMYFSLMDLGRVDFMIRTGLWAAISKKNWYPVVVSETMRFKKSLNPFQRFEIRTKTLGWDEKYFYLEQAFYRKDQICALAMVKARFLSKKGELISPQQILDLVTDHKHSPELPEYLKDWLKGDSAHIKSV